MKFRPKAEFFIFQVKGIAAIGDYSTYETGSLGQDIGPMQEAFDLFRAPVIVRGRVKVPRRN